MSSFERRFVDPKDPRPTREAAIAASFKAIPKDALVVCANGHPSREAHKADDRKGNFYMIGSMGMAPSIGLGLAIAQPDKLVCVLDGDGNVLMGMGTLARVAATRPRKFLHVCLDNREYGSTGGQRTISADVKLEEIARGAGYARVARVTTVADLAKKIDEFKGASGPSFILAEVASGEPRDLAPRVVHEPPAIARRVREAALA